MTLIEQLQPHNLPHTPDGSFIITDKQREAILSLLSENAGLQRWKAEAIAVMPDYHAIGEALKVPLGQSIHDKILPAIQQLSKEQGMRWVKASDRLPSIGEYNALYNGDHIVFQVHAGGFRTVFYNGKFDDEPQLRLIKWLDESADLSNSSQNHPHMTDKQIADQIETLKSVGKEARASKETAKQFLKDAGITTHTPAISLAAVQSVINNAPYISEYQKQSLLNDLKKVI